VDTKLIVLLPFMAKQGGGEAAKLAAPKVGLERAVFFSLVPGAVGVYATKAF
jgi:hypothetical protein